MTDFATALVEHSRLAMLRELLQLPGYSTNDSYLQGVLKGLGLAVTRDAARDHLVWLGQQQLVTLALPADKDGPLVATLTEHGLEVATGTRKVDGVQSPLPHQIQSAVMAASTQEAIDLLLRRRSG